ncbi:MAG: hypothetical protein OEV42_14755 [Deltaproteobacteria bacterium]|nr:hypothetical protein [Deltaproteobacteria bacterium]
MKILINIGDYSFHRCPRLKISGKRGEPLNNAEITLPDPAGELYQSMKEDDVAYLEYGYRSEAAGSWTGTVKDIKQVSRGQICVKAIGPERVLSETIINQAWKDDSPEAIVKYAINRTGLDLGTIEKPGPVFPHFVASSIPVWQVASQCKETCEKGFGKDLTKWALWLGVDGVNWGDFDEPGSEPVFKTGANIIEHLPGLYMNELNFLETFLLPGFSHSMVFSLKDTRRGIDGSFRAETVEHIILPDKARTFIGYGNE